MAQLAPHVLSAGLAVLTLSPYLVQVGAVAGATTTAAFAVGTSHSSLAVRAQHHDELCIKQRSFVGAKTPGASSASWTTPPSCRALYHCFQPTTMGGGGKIRERRGFLSHRARMLFWPLRASASVSSSAEGARSGLVSTGGEHGKVRRSSGGGSDATEYGGVDLTAPTEVQRPASIRKQMLQMLRPDLPRVRQGEIRRECSVFLFCLSTLSRRIIFVFTLWQQPTRRACEEPGERVLWWCTFVVFVD